MDLLKDLGFDPPKKLNIQAVACKKYYFAWNPKVYSNLPSTYCANKTVLSLIILVEKYS